MATPASTPVTPTPSRRIGRYEIVGRLGGGGMATVYAGRLRGPAGFERLVALKVCHEHLNDDPSFVDMFLDEARIAAAIRHPNVVSTIEVHTEPRLYMVMELVDGWPLHRLLADRDQPLPIPIALRVLGDALEGLHAAHALVDAEGRPLKVIHRDVTPANILVGADGVTRLTDFGVARAEQRAATTKDGSVKGKFGYMAPEQLRFDEIDQRVDVFAAGVCLFEALTGRRLFRGDSEADTVARVLSGPIPKPSSHRPEIPPELDAIVLKALARDQDRRYPTADALAKALAACPIDRASAAEVATFLAELPPALPKPVHESLVATLKDGERSGVTRRRPSRATSIGALAAAALLGAAVAAFVAVQLTGGDSAAPEDPPRPPEAAEGRAVEPDPQPPVVEAPAALRDEVTVPPPQDRPAEPEETAEPEAAEAAAEPARESTTSPRRRGRRGARRRAAEVTPDPEPEPEHPPEEAEFTPSAI